MLLIEIHIEWNVRIIINSTIKAIYGFMDYYGNFRIKSVNSKQIGL